MLLFFFIFFFQAEDGIRDRYVTGVQTCALPISGLLLPPGDHEAPPQQGIVLAVGPGLDWWGGVGIKMPVAPGDHVVFPASAGVWIDIEEERLLVCRVGQLLGVLEEVEG